jgi:hypothetical protein
MSQVSIIPRKVSTDDCWLWAGGFHSEGYGICRVKIDGKWCEERAHRLMYENMVGKIPVGLVIDHLCRVKSCINPLHLETVTIGENVLRGTGTSAQNAKKSHCPRGHEYDTRQRAHGGFMRGCSVCVRAKARARALTK